MIRFAHLIGPVSIALMIGGGAGYFKGRLDGVNREAERNAEALRATQDRLFEAAERLSVASADLATARAEQEELAWRLENEARNDHDTCRLPSDRSVRRLKRRWPAAD